jgi:hypothetical protein
VPWQSGVLVSATDNLDTELMYVSDQGELRASTRFAGQQLYLVRHSVGLGNDNIQAFGRDGTTPYAPKTLLTLDEHLRVIARRGATTEWTFAGPFIFGMPDQALVGFGCRVQHGLSLQRSAAMLLDGDLKARKSLFFEDADVFDSGTVTTAGSLSAQGEYVVGRMAGSAPNPNANPSVLPVGLIVNFVHARQLPHEQEMHARGRPAQNGRPMRGTRQSKQPLHVPAAQWQQALTFAVRENVGRSRRCG